MRREQVFPHYKTGIVTKCVVVYCVLYIYTMNYGWAILCACEPSLLHTILTYTHAQMRTHTHTHAHMHARTHACTHTHTHLHAVSLDRVSSPSLPVEGLEGAEDEYVFLLTECIRATIEGKTSWEGRGWAAIHFCLSIMHFVYVCKALRS